MKGLYDESCVAFANSVMNVVIDSLQDKCRCVLSPWNAQLTDLTEYDFFISDKNRPEVFDAFPNIITVAVVHGAGSHLESLYFETPPGDFRYWREYDYAICWYDYLSDEDMARVLELPSSRLIVADKKFEGTYDAKLEKEFIICNIMQFDWQFLFEIKQNMQETPLVTIITASFNLIKGNREDMIQQCIESVKTQTYKAIEHIIIDGASTDGTLELLQNYEKQGDVRVYSEPDKGIYDAMNKGIKHAKGEYIAFLNSDDYYCDVNAIYDVVNGLTKTKADYAFGNAIFISEESGKELFVRKGNIHMMPFEMPYIHQTHVVRTDAMRALKGFDLSYPAAADYDVVLRLYKEGYTHCAVDKTYAAFRLGGFSSEAEATHQSHYDCALSFFTHFGKKLGFSFNECKDLWYFKFLATQPKEYQTIILAKLSKSFRLEMDNLSIPYSESRKSKLLVGLRYVYDAIFPGKDGIVHRMSRRLYHLVRRAV